MNFHRLNRLLLNHPIKMNCAFSLLTFGLGDILSQYLEIRLNPEQFWDFKRFIIQSSFGIIITPYYYLQFNILMPRLMPVYKKFYLTKNLIYDQSVGAVCVLVLFFGYIDLISGKTFTEMNELMKLKMWPSLVDTWKVWPILQAINFSIIPIHLRVLFVYFFSIFYNAYLSYVQNNKKI